MKILVLDIGGTNLKIYATGHLEAVKVPSGPTFTPKKAVKAVQEATAGWAYSVISIGYPGPVVHGKPVHNPANLGAGWVDFDFAKAFGCPVKIINDAAMQALGSYRGGRMLFLGLGTGLGSAFIVDGVVEPMELAHLPYKHGRSFEEHVGAAALERMGKKKWGKSVHDVVAQLKNALQADYVVLGGGNAKRLASLPPGAFAGDNTHAREGGFRMWQSEKQRKTLAAVGD
jgi:predicted NBD/HSP70 family sugar kinase